MIPLPDGSYPIDHLLGDTVPFEPDLAWMVVGGAIYWFSCGNTAAGSRPCMSWMWQRRGQVWTKKALPIWAMG